MPLFTISPDNLLKLPALVKIGQIVLLIITIGIAQGGESYPGFGEAITGNVTTVGSGEQTNETLHCIKNKHLYFYGAGICTCYLINCCVLVLCYLLDDIGTQSSKFELVTSSLGSILFLAMAMRSFVGSSSKEYDAEDNATKLITEGCCCLGVGLLQIFDAIFIHRRIKKGGAEGGW